jgi:hypothetical protein
LAKLLKSIVYPFGMLLKKVIQAKKKQSVGWTVKGGKYKGFTRTGSGRICPKYVSCFCEGPGAFVTRQ